MATTEKNKPRSRRGRPLKYGRTSNIVSITLPDDVVQGLSALDADLGWAVVKLYQQASRRKASTGIADLVQFPGNRALILVRPDVCANLRGVSLIPLSDGRAFLALDQTKGVADLEISVVDRLDARDIAPGERTALRRLRQLLKQWRLEGVQFESRSIVVAQLDGKAREHRALPAIQRHQRERQ